MSKSKFGWYLAAILAVANLALVLCWIVLPRMKQGEPGEGPRKVVIERLKLNDEQIKAYEALIADHQAKVKGGNEQIVASKNALYAQLKSEQTNQALIDSLSNVIALNHYAIEQVHFQHFQQIRAICEPAQLPLFDALVLDLAQIFSKKPLKK